MSVILFNKPYGVVCQFSGDAPTLADYIDIPKVYAAGRLDKDSEGLLLLTDDGALQQRLSNPRFKLEKTYWVQVEGSVDRAAIATLQSGVLIKTGHTQPAKVKIITAPPVWQRTPPIRFRANIPTTWLEMKISEGKNRQLRRMTAAVGHPTLRLIRVAIGDYQLADLALGCWRQIE